MGKKRANPVTDDEILSAYARERVVKKVAAVLGIAATTAHRVLARHGVDASHGLLEYRRQARIFGDAEAAAIRSRYEAGETVAAILADVGGSYDSLKRAIKRAGGTLRENPAQLAKPGEVERVRRMYESGISQQELSIRLGRSQTFISRLMKKHGIQSRGNRGGAGHSHWRGGEFVRPDGYRAVMVDATDPLAAMRDRAGYVLEHRLVMARHLGRALAPQETVHHVNGTRTDNRIENLQLRQGKHGKGVVMRCRACGSHDIESTRIADDAER